MTNTTTKNVDTLTNAVVTFMNEFFTQIKTKKDKIKTKNLLSAFEEQTDALSKLIKANMPVMQARKLVDPKAPKRPRSAYICFTMQNRDAVKACNGNASAKEILSILGTEWKKLSDKKRDPYVAMHEKEKKR